MATEKSYADRVGRAELLQGTITGFGVPLIPSEPDNAIPVYEAYWQSCRTKNETIDSQAESFSVQTGQRVNHTKVMKSVVTRVQNHVLSVKALKDYWKTTKIAGQRITTFKPTKTKPPVEGETGTEKKKRNKGELGYADISNNHKAFVSILTSMGGGYTPSSPDLTIATLTASRTTLDDFNKDIGVLAGALSVGRIQRVNMFDKENGLSDRMISLKKNVFSQYGGNSAEYLSVKGIKV